MIDWKEAQFRQIAIHQVGNSSAGKPLALSEQLTQVFPEDYPLMISHFLEPFRDREAYAFDFANGEVDLNAAYKFIQRLFDHPGHLLNISQDLARHLYEAAVHPNIKDGAFCVVHFNQVIYEDEVTDAVVLCKVEDQETFIQLLEADHHFVLNKQEGIPFQQLDKGCLIINTDRESGYQVFIIDQSNRALEAQYILAQIFSECHSPSGSVPPNRTPHADDPFFCFPEPGRRTSFTQNRSGALSK